VGLRVRVSGARLVGVPLGGFLISKRVFPLLDRPPVRLQHRLDRFDELVGGGGSERVCVREKERAPPRTTVGCAGMEYS